MSLDPEIQKLWDKWNPRANLSFGIAFFGGYLLIRLNSAAAQELATPVKTFLQYSGWLILIPGILLWAGTTFYLRRRVPEENISIFRTDLSSKFLKDFEKRMQYKFYQKNWHYLPALYILPAFILTEVMIIVF